MANSSCKFIESLQNFLRFRSFLLLVILLLGAVLACSKEEDETQEPTEPTPEQLIQTESREVSTYEVVSISSKVTLKHEYDATLGDHDIKLTKVSDTTLAFFVPEISSGDYELKSELGNLEFRISRTSVEDGKALINNIFEEFDSEISKFSPASNDFSEEINRSTKFKKEVQELYNSLDDEEKRLTALFYQANKDIFTEFRQSTSNLSTKDYNKSVTSCSIGNYKEVYSCRAENLKTSAVNLRKSSTEFLVLVGLAGGLATLAAPATAGLSLFGAGLAMTTAAYILVTEVKPAFLMFKDDLKEFLYTNWIFVKAFGEVMTEEFNSLTLTDLGIDAKFRTVKSTDNEISNNVNLFNKAYHGLQDNWNKLAVLFGSSPKYISDERSVTLETEDISIRNISNSNVKLVSQEGERAKFESLSGEEEEFTFEIEVSKEGFEYKKTHSAIVKEENFDYEGTWLLTWYFEDGTVWEYDRIVFNAEGEMVSEEYNMPTNNSDWGQTGYTYSMDYDGTLNIYVLALTLSFYVNDFDQQVFQGIEKYENGQVSRILKRE